MTSNLLFLFLEWIIIVHVSEIIIFVFYLRKENMFDFKGSTIVLVNSIKNILFYFSFISVKFLFLKKQKENFELFCFGKV